MTKKIVRVGFIGVGNMANAHALAFADIENVELVGVYSRTRSKVIDFKKKHNVHFICDSIKSLFELNIDLIVIAVNELELRKVCSEAFLYQWNILIEKPLGYNYEDSCEIRRLAAEGFSKSYVALNRRHYSSTKILMDEIKKNNSPRYIRICDQESPYLAKLSGSPDLVVQNWMYANSVHLIDYFSFLCRGNIKEVINIEKTKNYVLSVIRFSSEDFGVYECFWDMPGPWAVSVNVDEVRYELRPLEKLTCQRYGSRELLNIDIDEWDLRFKPGIRGQAQEMIDIVLGGENRNIPTLDEAFQTIELVRSIYNA
jgi:predicted dehydrogenase